MLGFRQFLHRQRRSQISSTAAWKPNKTPIILTGGISPSWWGHSWYNGLNAHISISPWKKTRDFSPSGKVAYSSPGWPLFQLSRLATPLYIGLLHCNSHCTLITRFTGCSKNIVLRMLQPLIIIAIAQNVWFLAKESPTQLSSWRFSITSSFHTFHPNIPLINVHSR